MKAPGSFGPVVADAAREGRPLTVEEREAVEAAHPFGDPGKSCPGCRFRFSRGRRHCPNRLYAEGMHRAARDALPRTHVERPCRTRGCSTRVLVPVGSADGGLCDCCSAQMPLDFGGSS